MSDQPPNEPRVGYGNPPIEHRFKPGQSGNAKGRPKKTNTIPGLLLESINEEIIFLEGGKQKKAPLIKIVYRQLAAKAAKGDAKATDQLIKLMHSHGITKLTENETGPEPDYGAEVRRKIEMMAARRAEAKENQSS